MSHLGALVVIHAILRRLTSWRCIIYYYYLPGQPWWVGTIYWN